MNTLRFDRLLAELSRLGRPRVLVLGDLMLDRYTWGEAARVSQEAPILVLQADAEETRLGGAANVANMAQALGAEVCSAGVVGTDADGQQLRDLLQGANVDASCVIVDRERVTTVKQRFIGRAAGRHRCQLLRVDREQRSPLAPIQSDRLKGEIIHKLNECDALLISDYDKGVCTPELVQSLIQHCQRERIPVITDPRQQGPYTHYAHSTVLKPNRAETASATGHLIRDLADALAAGQQLCQQLETDYAVITLDRQGMVGIGRDGTQLIYPTQAREVYDITGAGDVVLAVLGVCLAGGLSIDAAIALGNLAAGIEVQREGVVTVSRAELRAELLARSAGHSKVRDVTELLPELELLRRGGKRIVFTNGCFDLLHCGHVSYLQEAAALGDVLIVGINSDASVRRLKGESRPIVAELQRMALLSALECVDFVVKFGEDTPHRLLENLRPDVLVKGGTYQRHEVVGHEIVEAYGGQVAVMGMVDGISTTQIVDSIQKKNVWRKAS